MSIDKIIWEIIKREGGFVNHKNDMGGATKYGITQETLSKWRCKQVTVEDVKNLTKSEAYDIYNRWYYLNPNIDSLPASIQPIMTDMAVNHGPKKSIKMLQEVINQYGNSIGLDGICGAQTVRLAKELDKQVGKDFINSIVARRLAFYESIVRHDESQAVFLNGWRTRAASFLAG